MNVSSLAGESWRNRRSSSRILAWRSPRMYCMSESWGWGTGKRGGQRELHPETVNIGFFQFPLECAKDIIEMFFRTALCDGNDILLLQEPVNGNLCRSLPILRAHGMQNLRLLLQEKNITDRTKCHEHPIMGLCMIEQSLFFRRTVCQIEMQLIRNDWMPCGALCLFELRHCKCAYADVSDESFIHKTIHRPHGFCNRNCRIRIMDKIEIEIVCP